MGAVNSASCPNNCNAAAGGGTCNPATNLCECNTLRDGFDCSIILCVDNCNGPDRGICDQGVCFCNANYTGDLCQFRTCLGGCGEEVNHGTCDDGTCICVSDDVGSWNGPTCDTFSVNCAPRDCSGHGVCPISDADAAALTIQLELSSPYNRTEFIDAIVYELGILEECLLSSKSQKPTPTPVTRSRPTLSSSLSSPARSPPTRPRNSSSSASPTSSLAASLQRPAPASPILPSEESVSPSAQRPQTQTRLAQQAPSSESQSPSSSSLPSALAPTF